MLASDKVHPKCAYEASGLFTDTEEAARLGLQWYEQVKAEQARQAEQELRKAKVTVDE